jgi:PadR family transcriptional regulator, regulatory protein AphA
MIPGVSDGNETVLLEYAAGDCLLQKEADALDLVAACGEHGCNRLLIDAACLSEDFFRLRTGLAGAVLQKFVNYSIKAAIVAPPGSAQQGKFKDFMLEANRGGQFRIFSSRQAAIDWLVGK